MEMSDLLDKFIVKTINCPACDDPFQTYYVRTAALRPKRRDSDFYVEWDGLNPEHYVVQVCPTCLYAAYRSDFGTLNEESRARMRGDAGERRERFGVHGFSGIRNVAAVQASYELALRCYAVRQYRRYAIYASLCLHMAWLAREMRASDREKHYLNLALNYYQKSYTHDKLHDPEGEIRQTYLIGELSLQLGHLDEAIHWFNETVKHPEIDKSPGLESRARERWAAAREGSHLKRANGS
jgi:uncharacterized protein